jgi:hypothetical protein
VAIDYAQQMIDRMKREQTKQVGDDEEDETTTRRSQRLRERAERLETDAGLRKQHGDEGSRRRLRQEGTAGRHEQKARRLKRRAEKSEERAEKRADRKRD